MNISKDYIKDVITYASEKYKKEYTNFINTYLAKIRLKNHYKIERLKSKTVVQNLINNDNNKLIKDIIKDEILPLKKTLASLQQNTVKNASSKNYLVGLTVGGKSNIMKKPTSNVKKSLKKNATTKNNMKIPEKPFPNLSLIQKRKGTGKGKDGNRSLKTNSSKKKRRDR